LKVADVDAAHAKVTLAGYRAISAPFDFGIHQACYVYGPDGEIVELLDNHRSDSARLAKIMEDERRHRDQVGPAITDAAFPEGQL
jgi:hypothetical protein